MKTSQPDHLPVEMQHYGNEQPDMLDVGDAGKDGVLRLTFAENEFAETYIAKQYTQLPFHITRPLRLDERLPGMAFLYIQMPTGGTLQGDRMLMDVTVNPKAMVHLTTQSLTKIYKMNKNYASQTFTLHVDDGAYVEYYPDALLLQKSARYAQSSHIILHENAHCLFGEIILPGRVASDERFEYETYHSSLTVTDPKDTLLFKETLLLEPTKRSLHGIGTLGTYDVFGNFYVFTRNEDCTAICADLHTYLGTQDDVLGGVSELPNNCGIVIRLLGEHHRHVKTAMDTVWDMTRQFMINVPAPRIRK